MIRRVRAQLGSWGDVPLVGTEGAVRGTFSLSGPFTIAKGSGDLQLVVNLAWQALRNRTGVCWSDPRALGESAARQLCPRLVDSSTDR